jgi:hypothetical protein
LLSTVTIVSIQRRTQKLKPPQKNNLGTLLPTSREKYKIFGNVFFLKKKKVFKFESNRMSQDVGKAYRLKGTPLGTWGLRQGANNDATRKEL